MPDTDYPGALDAFEPPTGSGTLSQDPPGTQHHEHHARHYAAIRALQETVGVDGENLGGSGAALTIAGYVESPFTTEFIQPSVVQNGTEVGLVDGSCYIMGTVTPFLITDQFPYDVNDGYFTVDWSLYLLVDGSGESGPIVVNPLNAIYDLVNQAYPETPEIGNFTQLLNPLIPWSGVIANDNAIGLTYKAPFFTLTDMVGSWVTDQLQANDNIYMSGTYLLGMTVSD